MRHAIHTRTILAAAIVWMTALLATGPARAHENAEPSAAAPKQTRETQTEPVGGYIRVTDRSLRREPTPNGVASQGISYEAYWQGSEQSNCDSNGAAGETNAGCESRADGESADDCNPAPGCEQPCDCGCCASACCCETCCEPKCCGEPKCCCEPCPPWRLFPQTCCGPTIIGWVQQGMTTNTHNPANPSAGFGNFPVQPNYRNDEYQLNQIYLSIERAANTGGYGWDYGYRVDAMYGEDYFVVTSPGLEERPNGVQHWNRAAGSGLFGEGRLGVALPQFYAELAYRDLSVKVGHFYGLTDYESVMPLNNFFYSHSYAYSYSGPFTHTGVLASYDASSQWNIKAGLVNGWNNVDAVTDRPAFLGSIRWTSYDERTFVSLAAITGDEAGSAPPILGNRTLYSLVVSHEFGDGWRYVLQHNNGFQDNARSLFPRGIRNGSWYGVNQYLTREINEQWAAGVRFEWFNDQTGGRVTNGGAHWYALTGGVNYQPCANVTIRPEVRCDWASFHTPGAGADPFSNGTKDYQLLFGVDAIVTF